MIRRCIFLVPLLFQSFCLALVEYPKACLKNVEATCYFGTVKKASRYEIANMELFFDKDTLLKMEKNSIEWIYGSVLFEVSSQSHVKFKNFSIELQKGKYFFYGSEGKLNVEVLDGNFILDKFQVTEGFRAQFALSNGVIQNEPLQAIDLKDHLVRYAKIKKLNRKEALDYLEDFRIKHRNYLAWAAELNERLVNRSIANDLKLERERNLAQERARLAQQKRRQMFFEKVFER